jgi:class 3 adenylate cyclase
MKCLNILQKIRSLELGEDTSGPEDPTGGEGVEALLKDPLYALDLTKETEERVIDPGYCLVVDDNARNRDFLTRLLVRQGHKVATAANGREALERIRADSFDIVFLDIMMPEMNGFEVLRHMRADEQMSKLPVIVISGLSDVDFIAHCIGMGAEDYLPKPFDPVLLKARLGACLEKKRFRDREAQYLKEIEKERARADELLHVILPGPIVAELKETDRVRPRVCENVAVLFADLVGFTSYCGEHSAEEVVSHLQTLVVAWENSALSHGVEKIKTIGDAFMAAAGLLQEQENPVLSCVRCGLEMIAATRSLPGVKWDLRVGVHVGPVVAGVIGQRQYLFDLWGDTVNTAARMESNGMPGRITLTEEAWARVRHLGEADTDYVSPKGKGKMAVYRFRDFVS